MNPLDEKKLEDLYKLIPIRSQARVTDIGCGKGEMLIRLAEKNEIKGVGVDKSPYCIKEAERNKRERVPQADLHFLELDGAQYKPETEESQDLTMCIGASWIYGGYKKTLKALSQMTKRSGHLMVGEPFWRRTPPQAYLKREKISRNLFSTHQGNVSIGEAIGLEPLYTLVSNESDWDKYEGLHWYAASEYASSRPEDPDVKDLLARNFRARESYLKYERDILGWAVYLFQRTN
jgi:trans-aconitate methyltransferase